MKMLRTGDHAVHGPLTAEYAGQGAGVHAFDPGDIILFQISVKLSLTAEVAAPAGQVPDDERLRPGTGGFIVLVVDAVITDERIAHHNALPGIGRIGQNLLIARHRGIEHHLTDPVGRGADAPSREDCAAGQDQSRLHLRYPAFRSHILICSILSQISPTDNPVFPPFLRKK